MPRLVPVHWEVLVRVFKRYGCAYKRKKGSHHVLLCPGARRAIVITEYEEVDVDIIKSNMRTVGMSREEYFELLQEVL